MTVQHHSIQFQKYTQHNATDSKQTVCKLTSNDYEIFAVISVFGWYVSPFSGKQTTHLQNSGA